MEQWSPLLQMTQPCRGRGGSRVHVAHLGTPSSPLYHVSFTIICTTGLPFVPNDAPPSFRLFSSPSCPPSLLSFFPFPSTFVFNLHLIGVLFILFFCFDRLRWNIDHCKITGFSSGAQPFPTVSSQMSHWISLGFFSPWNECSRQDDTKRPFPVYWSYHWLLTLQAVSDHSSVKMVMGP